MEKYISKEVRLLILRFYCNRIKNTIVKIYANGQYISKFGLTAGAWKEIDIDIPNNKSLRLEFMRTKLGNEVLASQIECDFFSRFSDESYLADEEYFVLPTMQYPYVTEICNANEQIYYFIPKYHKQIDGLICFVPYDDSANLCKDIFFERKNVKEKMEKDINAERRKWCIIGLFLVFITFLFSVLCFLGGNITKYYSLTKLLGGISLFLLTVPPIMLGVLLKDIFALKEFLIRNERIRLHDLK